MTNVSLNLAIEAALVAGEAILSFYKSDVTYINKKDNTPLTKADSASNNLICKKLFDAGYPIVSEEGENLFLNATDYWLVDPLDGTKDFLAQNDEFTINIAFIKNHKPILGVIYAPALDELYAAQNGNLVIKIKGIQTPYPRFPNRSDELSMAVSRFHDDEGVPLFATQNNIKRSISMGSALKFGRLALGVADIYPRLVGSSEWDTAAGQAVLEAAGGQVLDWNSGEALRYGKKLRRNPRLISLRSPYLYEDFTFTKYESQIL